MLSQRRHILKDEDLVDLYREGNQYAFNQLLERYHNQINIICNTFFAIGLSKQDLFQEGAIGLYTAIKKYDRTKNVPFKFYAKLYMNSRIINAVKKATRKKNLFMNVSLSLDAHKIKFSPRKFGTPEDIFIREEEAREIVSKLEKLSRLERESLLGIINGLSYEKIANQLGVTKKTVDNAIQRAKKKLSEEINT